MNVMKRVGCALALLLALACNSTAPPAPAATPGTINMKEPRRMFGTESNVRVDAEIYGEEMTQGASIAIKYEITNQRATPILIADLIAQSNYDSETRTVTIDIGSEVPGEELLPRLLSIPAGERRTFRPTPGCRSRTPCSFASTSSAIQRRFRCWSTFRRERCTTRSSPTSSFRNGSR